MMPRKHYSGSSASSGAGGQFSLTPVKKSVYKRLQTLLESEEDYETVPLAIRVPKRIKLIYMLMSKEEKRLFKSILIKLFENYAEQVFNLNQNINVNINMNIINNNVNNTRSDFETIHEVKEFLRKLVEPGPYLAPPPKWVVDKAKELLKKLH